MFRDVAQVIDVRPSGAGEPGRVRGWPLALGVLFAFGLGAGFGRGVAGIVMVCAVIYLFAAVTGRPGSAWLGFVMSGPAVALGPLLDAEWVSLALIGGLAVVLVMVGVLRQTWREPAGRWQVPAAAAFSVVAVAALLVAPTPAALLLAAGLVGHGVWDVVHHRRAAVVTRPYAEFCAALDFALAAVVLASVVW